MDDFRILTGSKQNILKQGNVRGTTSVTVAVSSLKQFSILTTGANFANIKKRYPAWFWTLRGFCLGWK